MRNCGLLERGLGRSLVPAAGCLFVTLEELSVGELLAEGFGGSRVGCMVFSR